MPTAPHNLVGPTGDYFEAWLGDDLNIYVRHADIAGGSFAATVQVTASADCADPKLIVLPNRRCFLTYSRGYHLTLSDLLSINNPEFADPAVVTVDFAGGADATAIYERTSDDEGATWSSETQVTVYGANPTYACDSSGALLRSWIRNQYFPVAGGPAWVIYGSFQAAGDTSASAVFQFGSIYPTVDDDGFPAILSSQAYGLTWSRDGRWWAHWPDFSTGRTILAHSTDEGQTWSAGRIAGNGDVIQSGSLHLGVSAGQDGGLLIWAMTGSFGADDQIIVGYLAPGQNFADPGGGNATFGSTDADCIRDDTSTILEIDLLEHASFAQAREHAGRWFLATRLFGETDISTWWSADDGKTCKRL
jgi:hypothetical protein